MSHWHWGQYQAHTFYLVPSMGPIILVMTVQGWQKIALEKQTNKLASYGW